MSITYVEAGDLLPETAPRSRRIKALSRSAAANACQKGIVLVESSRTRHDRLATITESERHTKVIALASLRKWLKLCDRITADLVLLSQLDNRSVTDRVYDVAHSRGRKPSARIFTILKRYAVSPPPADKPLHLKFIFEEFNIV